MFPERGKANKILAPQTKEELEEASKEIVDFLGSKPFTYTFYEEGGNETPHRQLDPDDPTEIVFDPLGLLIYFDGNDDWAEIWAGETEVRFYDDRLIFANCADEQNIEDQFLLE